MLFLALAALMGSRAEQGADPAVIVAIATEICGSPGPFPPSTLDVNDVTIFASSLGVIGTSLRDSGGWSRRCRRWPRRSLFSAITPIQIQLERTQACSSRLALPMFLFIAHWDATPNCSCDD